MLAQIQCSMQRSAHRARQVGRMRVCVHSPARGASLVGYVRGYSSQKSNGRAVIVGGGPIGGAMACIFRRQGFEVDLFERYEDLREKPLNARRSINLVLARRGLQLAESLGLREALLKRGIPVYGRMIHKDGQQHYQAYGKGAECNYSIDRGELNAFWLEQADKAGAKLHFQKQLKDFDIDAGWCEFAPTAAADTSKIDTKSGGISVDVQLEKDAGVERVENASILLACDGGGSVVRENLVAAGKLTQKKNFIEWGYKEVMFPAAPGGKYALDGDSLHIWPRGDHFLMGLANPDGSFTGTMYADDEFARPDGCMLKDMPPAGEDEHKCGQTPQGDGRPSFQSTGKDFDSAKAFFEEHYADVIPYIDGDKGIQQYCENPVGLLGTVRTNTYLVEGRSMHAVLAGDAAHAVVPFFGQGVQSGFEDAFVMDRCLETALKGDLSKTLLPALKEYSNLRVPDCWALRDLAIDNMTEMGTKVGDDKFLLAKAVERKIEKDLAHKYRSRYALVCYSYNRYSHVLELGKVQEEIIQELISQPGVSSADDVDMGQAEKLIDSKLVPRIEELGMSMDLGNQSSMSI